MQGRRGDLGADGHHAGHLDPTSPSPSTPFWLRIVILKRFKLSTQSCVYALGEPSLSTDRGHQIDLAPAGV